MVCYYWSLNDKKRCTNLTINKFNGLIIFSSLSYYSLFECDIIVKNDLMKGNLIETKMMLSLPDVSDLNRNCLFFMIKVLTYIVGLNSVLKFKVKDQIEKLND